MPQDKNVVSSVKAVYTLFARGFSRPMDKAFFDDCALVFPLIRRLFPLEEEIVREVERFGLEEESNMNRLYSSLFLTGAFGKTISPCESVYLSEEGLVMQDERDFVLMEYAAAKAGLSPSFKEPEDHIAAELSFAAYLAGENEARLLFIRNHPLKWIGLFEKDLELYGGGVYKNLAYLARIFMKLDLKTFSE